jgi:hypothetical protein
VSEKNGSNGSKTSARMVYRGGFISDTHEVKLLVLDGSDQQVMLETPDGEFVRLTRDEAAFRNVERIEITFQD